MLIRINTDDLEIKTLEGICQRIKDANVIKQLAINLACNSQTSVRTRCVIAGLYTNNYNVMSALCEADETTLEVIWDVFNCTQSESVAKCIIDAKDGNDQLLTAIANKYHRLVPDIMREWDVEVTVTTKSE